MKRMRKIFSVMLALIMMMGMAMNVSAAGTGTITITPPTGVDDDATNTYKIYKVFDAVGDGTNISYKLVSGKTTAPAGFTVDGAGNVTYTGAATDGKLTADDIAAIAAYVTENDLVATVTAKGSATTQATGLTNGYYYITTSTGSVVTIDSTNPDATVEDKNEVPTLKKEITDADSVDEDGKKALAQVGTDVEYKVTITVEDGVKGYEFHDKMSAGLQYNDDVSVWVDGSEVYGTNYDTTTASGDTITIKFDDDWIKTQVGKEIVIKYSAKITSDALQTDPAKNTAWLEYGDENSNNKTPEDETEVYNAKFTVTKKDGNGEALEGAGFVLKNSEGKYYKLDNNEVTWVEDIEDAEEHFSDENGAVKPFTGLPNGTYTLVEKTVPSGYNKAADFIFTVAEGNYESTNLEQSTTVVNNSGTELPSTGGMGTTLFYLIGGIMVAVAAVLLITKKRMNNK